MSPDCKCLLQKFHLRSDGDQMDKKQSGALCAELGHEDMSLLQTPSSSHAESYEDPQALPVQRQDSKPCSAWRCLSSNATAQSIATFACHADKAAPTGRVRA